MGVSRTLTWVGVGVAIITIAPFYLFFCVTRVGVGVAISTVAPFYLLFYISSWSSFYRALTSPVRI